MNHIFNKTEYKPRRQALRSNMTEPEKKLWQILRGEQMGVKFRRQHGIGHYIADFYCPELKLVIEVDGDSHESADAQAYDAVRHDFRELHKKDDPIAKWADKGFPQTTLANGEVD